MVGQVTSLGDTVMKSDLARTLFNLNGTGVKIGIISTSFNSLSGLDTDIQSGDLPGANNPFGRSTPVTILRDLTSNSPFANDEGRALAQIIHDIAPGTQIFFHSLLQSNEKAFDNAVSALIAQGVDIIIDDAVVPATLFQDGIAATAVEKATNAGIIYISAAGNNGNISYESKFRPGAKFSLADTTFVAHDFDPGTGVDLFQDITATQDGTTILPLLSWDQPLANVQEEYVMFLLNTPSLPNFNNIVSFSVPPSLDALNAPLSSLLYQPHPDETLYLTIARVSPNTSATESTIKWVSYANGADLTTNYEYVDKSSLNRTIIGQANASSSITVGASDVNNPLESRQDYSSRGGSSILFDPQL